MSESFRFLLLDFLLFACCCCCCSLVAFPFFFLAGVVVLEEVLEGMFLLGVDDEEEEEEEEEVEGEAREGNGELRAVERTGSAKRELNEPMSSSADEERRAFLVVDVGQGETVEEEEEELKSMVLPLALG
jgi:hypothetical protein